LSGQLEPGKHVIAAIPGLVDRTSFSLPAGVMSGAANIGVVTLMAPTSSGYNDESATVPTINTSTVKELDGPLAYYYVKREVSSTTGNYLSGFSFNLPTERLKNDELYSAPAQPSFKIVEIYADAVTCSPLEVSSLCVDYVKIFNGSAETLDLSSYRIRTGSYGQAPSSSNARNLNGSVLSGHYVSVPLSLSSAGSWVWIEDLYGTARYDDTMVQYPSGSGHSNEAWSYDRDMESWRWTNTPMPNDTPNVFPSLPKVNRCEEIRIAEIAANVSTESQFVEIYNPTDAEIDTFGCVIQTNRSAQGVVLPSSSLGPKSRQAIYIKDTSLTLTKTTTGTVYILSSDGLMEVHQVSYSNLEEGTAWADIGGNWVQTYSITPGGENINQHYPACQDGYIRNIDTGNCNKIAGSDTALSDCGPGKYRSPDTNRCRSLEALATALTPCDIGQYRNPETNRCRSLLATTSSLSACSAGMERNPETNRCRSVSADTELKQCNENQERNPETNRCRNKIGNVKSDFPVEVVAQSSEATLGWWAFGGVGTLAAGYAGWEWRREVSSWIRKILPLGIGLP